MKKAIAFFVAGLLAGTCTIASFGGPKCSTAYANRSFAVVCR